MGTAGLLILLLPTFYVFCQSDFTDNPIVVSTYSLWNLRFSWDVRKLRISQMIREQDPDVIALHDVRGTSLDMTLQYSQISDLQKLVPSYVYSDYHPINKVSYPEHSYLHYGWRMSGFGILSKHPIIRSSKVDLVVDTSTELSSRGRKLNPRRVSMLYYHLGVVGVGTINVIVTHLSHDLREQCQSVAKIMKFINDERLHHVIVMGNFNITTKKSEEPIKVMTTYTLLNKSSCFGYFKDLLRTDANLFLDAWSATHSKRPGYTYRDIEHSTKLVSRPDRIMVAQYAVQKVSLTGRGDMYAKRFSVHLYFYRFWTVIGTARDSYYGTEGYPCLHDCGPNGICRCGICVKDKTRRSCNIPYCSECSPSSFTYFCAAVVSIIICMASFLHAVLRGLLLVNTFHDYDLRTRFGFNCCLCHPELYAPEMGKYTRKLRLSTAAKVASCYLPVFQHFIVSLLASLATFIAWRFIFSDVFYLVYQVPDQEWYPSDHLMVTGKLLLHPANRDNII